VDSTTGKSEHSCPVDVFPGGQILQTVLCMALEYSCFSITQSLQSSEPRLKAYLPAGQGKQINASSLVLPA
jgi:hypothetical protein